MTPATILSAAHAEHAPVAVFACISGGNDSTTTAHLTADWGREYGVEVRALHINTGIGIETTREHARRAADLFGLELWERHAATREYERFVLSHGFPGPAQHPRMYQRLKERVVYAVCREVKRGQHRNARVMFVTGIRSEESRIRSGYRRVVSKVRAQVWVNPIYHMTGRERDAYMAVHNIPRNPVSEWLGMSGECLCGAFADGMERTLIRKHAPDVDARPSALESEALSAGKPWRWHDAGPPEWWTNEQRGQLPLFTDRLGPMCAGCGKAAA